MFGLIKVPTIAYRPNTSVSIGSGGSVLLYKNQMFKMKYFLPPKLLVFYQYPLSQYLLREFRSNAHGTINS